MRASLHDGIFRRNRKFARDKTEHGAERKAQGADHDVRRGDVRRLIPEDRDDAQRRLRDHQRHPPPGEPATRHGEAPGRRTKTPGGPGDQRQQGQRHHPMRHVQVNLEGCNGVEIARIKPLRVVARDRISGRGRIELPVRERKIRHGQTGVLMPHRGTQEELDQDQHGHPGRQHHQSIRARLARGRPRLFHPTTAQAHCDDRKYDQKNLAQNSVQNPERRAHANVGKHMSIQHDAQSAQQAL